MSSLEWLGTNSVSGDVAAVRESRCVFMCVCVCACEPTCVCYGMFTSKGGCVRACVIHVCTVCVCVFICAQGLI